jgi:hypothetical protein
MLGATNMIDLICNITPICPWLKKKFSELHNCGTGFYVFLTISCFIGVFGGMYLQNFLTSITQNDNTSSETVKNLASEIEQLRKINTPRHLTHDQLSKLQASATALCKQMSISKTAGSVILLKAAHADTEAVNYMTEISNALRAVGCKVLSITFIEGGVLPPPSGLNIAVNRREKPDDDAVILQEIFASAGLEIKIRYDMEPLKEGQQWALSVGEKP